MSEAVSTQLKKNNRVISTDSQAPEIIKDPILNDFPGINTKQDLLALITENKQLNKKIDQFEALHKKAIRKFQQAQELKPYQAELIKLQQCLEKQGKKMIIIFEGRGGAGKGGIIRRITQYMNAKHYRVVALGKPTDEIRSQWFFQKFIQEFPRAGEMVLFDRSWYTRAMIEPVFGFCTDKEYRDFIKGVGGFEMDLIKQNTFIVKLYFSVSREEQVRRFAQREEDPLHRWKLSEVDLDAEEHWDEFTEAKYKMLRQTHTTHAPWTIIRSDNRHQARLNTMKVILNAALGFINMEQNKLLKIFSVAALIFLPPTLIGAIYGMNFPNMPEMSWPLGYPMVLGIMILAGVLPVLFLKLRGWL